MILEALYRMAMEEGLVADPDFEVRPVAWLVDVDAGGSLLGIRGTHTEVPSGTKGRTRLLPKPIRIPKRRTGKSGIRPPPDFLVDNALFVFGVSVGDGHARTDKGASRARDFRDAVRACAEATNDQGIGAVLALLEAVANGEAAVDLPADCKPNDLFAFIFAPDGAAPVHERGPVAAYWRQVRKDRESPIGEQVVCVVTGEQFSGRPLIPLVKGVPGATSSGGAIISFNANAFESHGWRSNANAPISGPAGDAIGAALARLLGRDFRAPSNPDEVLKTRHVRLTGDTVVGFWGKGEGGAALADNLVDLLEVTDTGRVGDLFRSIWAGRAIAIDDTSGFYGLTLSGAQGRIMIRDWFETTVAGAAANLAAHFAALDVVRNTPAPKGGSLPPAIPLRPLLGSLAPFGAADGIPSALAAAFAAAALRGGRYPLAILQRAVGRARAEIGRSEWSDLERRDGRAALIKAVLISHFNRKVTPDMDPTMTDSGYLLGRLMAVIERLQQVALGDVNASVVDRYFAAASATPRSVFTRLLRSARHHARKALDDEGSEKTARWLENQIDAIAAQFAPSAGGFPAHLNLEQQGLFMLGYHQQRHFLWMNREERDRWSARWNPSPDQAA